jgi:GTPase SAR1 family protein
VTKEQHQAHDRIERMLKEKVKKDVKMLLLGTGDSGKSTIAKQMRIIYLNGFSAEEKKKWKQIIHGNILSYMKILFDQLHGFGIEYSNPESPSNEALILQAVDSGELTLQLGAVVQSLWADEGIQATWERASEYQISDSAAYFLPRASDFAQVNYEVTDDDVLQTRVKTSGIVEIEFTVDNELFKLVDVGGQRSERKKWIHCFQDVKAIIFVVAMSEYNLFLEENRSVNRMLESLKLFDDIVNNMWFNNTNIILFLNKKDLFEEKIQKIDLNICFKEYTEGKDYEKASSYIRQQYEGKNKTFNDKRKIYTHTTCATQTDNIKFVWNTAKKIFLQENLGQLFIID